MFMMRQDYHKAASWVGLFALSGLLIGLVILLIAQPVADWQDHPGMSPAQWWVRTESFFMMLYEDPLRIIEHYASWWEMGLAGAGRPPLPFILAIAFFLLLVEEGLRHNPYDWAYSMFGNSRLATMRDLKRWARKRVIPWAFWLKARRAQPLLDDEGIILGRFRGRYLRNGDTLTCLVLAAPGSGKTAGVALPTILDKGNRNWSMFIFDIKGELFDLSAGFRSKFGPVFRFEPKGRSGARWNPLSPTRSLPGGMRLEVAQGLLDARLGAIYGDGRTARQKLLGFMRIHADWRELLATDPTSLQPGIRAQGIFGPEHVDLATEVSAILSDQESYLWRLATDLVPAPKGGGGNAEHFANTGRDALFGMMGFAIARARRVGIEPNLGLLAEWWTQDVNDAKGDAGDKEDDDAIAAMLDKWIDECDAYGYPDRYRTSLITLRNKPGKERGSVVSTADVALNIFKIASVRDRTSTSDFALDDMRGIKGSDGKSYPMTLYIVVSLEDIASMAPIMCMITTAVQSRLISQPASIAKKSRKVLSILDEFAQIPRMDILLKGPAVGRGQRVGNLLIAQSDGQIVYTYEQAGKEALYDTKEWLLVFPLTNQRSAQELSTAIGKQTVKTRSVGTKSFDPFAALTSKGDPGGSSYNSSLQGIPLFEPADLMSTDDGSKMKPDEQLVIVRGRTKRPIVVKTPYYFEDRTLDRRSKIPAPPPADAAGFCGPLARLKPVHETARHEKMAIRDENGKIIDDYTVPEGAIGSAHVTTKTMKPAEIDSLVAAMRDGFEHGWNKAA